MAAFNEITLDDKYWAGEAESGKYIPGCFYYAPIEFYFNPNLDAVSDLGDEAGGVCRVGGSPSVYQKAGDVPCSASDMITTLEDC
jgi:hypothetical protein